MKLCAKTATGKSPSCSCLKIAENTEASVSDTNGIEEVDLWQDALSSRVIGPDYCHLQSSRQA